MRKHLLLLTLLFTGMLQASAQTTVDTVSTCVPMCNGSITINASGGTAPYSYSIDGGTTFSSNNVFSGLCLDTFSIVVTDASQATVYTGTANTVPTGCQQLSSPLSFNYNVTASDSFGLFGITHCTGAVSFTINGGVPPYMLALENISTGTYTPWQSSTFFDSLCTGYYTLHIQDAVGSQYCYCYFPTTIFIPKECNVPAAVFSNYDCTNNNVILNAFSMDMTANYQWSSPSLNIVSPFAPFTSATGAPGTHIAMVDINVNGCPPSQQSLTVTLCTPVTLDNVTNSGGQLCAQVGSNTPPVSVAWYQGSTLIANANCIAAPSVTTNYSIVITNTCGCSDTMSYTSSAVSVGDLDAANISIYPNPTTGTLVITGDLSRLTRIVLFDLEGRQIFSAEDHLSELNIESLANGVYILAAENASGVFFRKRIVKTGN